MAILDLTADENALVAIAGRATFLRARRRVLAGEVKGAFWSAEFGEASAVVQDGGEEVTVAVEVVQRRASGPLHTVYVDCDCAAQAVCHHAVATVLAALPPARTSIQVGSAARREGTRARRPTTPSWETTLAPVVGAEPEPAPKAEQMALQVLCNDRKDGSLNLSVRLVKRLASGRWAKQSENWSYLRWRHWGTGYEGVAERQVTLLEELRGLLSTGAGHNVSDTLSLLEPNSRRLWDLLGEVQDAGLPIVLSKGDDPVVLHRDPVDVLLRAERGPSGVTLQPRMVVEGFETDLPAVARCGSPAHGVVWRDGAHLTGPGTLHLAPLRHLLPADVAAVLDQGVVEIPAQDEARFVEEFLPVLARRLTFLSDDPALTPPEAEPPELTLTVTAHPAHRVTLEWTWVYRLGKTERHVRLLPVKPGEERDAAGERTVLDAVLALPHTHRTVEAGTPPRLLEHAQLWGVETAGFVEDLLPALKKLPGVNVVEVGDMADYHELEDAPVIRFESQGTGEFGQEDWFDLAVQVSVGDQQVPFASLFTALVLGQTHLLLPNGAYFSLARDEYRKLAELIGEARDLADAVRGTSTLRLTRYQADLWAELDELGIVEGQAKVWRDAVRALTDAGDLDEAQVPKGLKATLRPYQEQGFQWLCALFARRLGGVLADDMGLGKTLQTLAFLLSLKERGELTGPALVVGPTSLIANWANEAARFAPDLNVVTITETERRRGAALADAVAGADLVITSYALFRLEYAAYEPLPWTALVLDEAQFVKNHTARGHQLAKKLPARFKVAITGTPMENTIMELWALFAITAPGLFPSPQRFTEYYRNPIEKEGDDERLALLRRRARPLMLRRTKSLVAADLPDKQEQVMELELDPKHRRAYQVHLDRERKKVLGLLGDVNQNRFEIFRSLTLLRQAALDVALVDPEAVVPSTKLDALMTLVQDAVSEGHRVIIFSQFTRFLGSARDRVKAADIPHAYLDGRTRNRDKVLTRFREGEAPVFLISLKAGGFGLNLTEADYCIVLDPWWNPATEAQAVDRIHRIGQTRKVLVYRLVVKDTIEDKVMALKARKAALFAGVLDDGSFENASLDASDIRELLS